MATRKYTRHRKTITATVSNRIKAEMKICDYRNHDMAEACAISDRTWRSWLTDPGKITLDYLDIIALKLGVNPADLLTEVQRDVPLGRIV